MESHNNKLQKLVKANPSVWEFMLGLRSAYRGDFQLIYNASVRLPTFAAFLLTSSPFQDWVNGVEKPRRTEDVTRDRRVLRQVRRWADVEVNKLQPAEWARGMVMAMKEL